MMKKCNCNLCTLPDEWKKLLSKYAQVWSSACDSSDMGIEFGIVKLFNFIEESRKLEIPKLKHKTKSRLKELKKIMTELPPFTRRNK